MRRVFALWYSDSKQIALPLYDDPNQCELFPNDLEAWIRWIEQLDLTCLGYRPVQESGRKVLLELCYRVGWDPEESGDRYGAAWPSVETIARNAFPACKNARRKTLRIMRRLEEAGYVERIERRQPNGGMCSNLYRLEPAMRKNAIEAAENGGVSISPQNDTLTKIEQKDEPHPAKRGGISVDNSNSSKIEKQRAKAWLRTKGVLALKYAAIAATDPEHWRRVQSAAKAHPEAGPGLIVGWLKDPDAIPKVKITGPKKCPHDSWTSEAMYVDDFGVRRDKFCNHCKREMKLARAAICE